MATRTIAYLRVSTEKQADRGVSLDAQRVKAAAYAELYELEIVEVIVDAGESAKTLDRPGLQRALAMLKRGEAGALLVVKLDRLTRSVADLGELVETYFSPGKAALLSVSEQIDTRSAGGRLVLNVLASVSQWERETIGERTAVAMQHKAAQGEYTGGTAPYGRRVGADGLRLEEDASELAARATARELRARGLSLRQVAMELEQRWHPEPHRPRLRAGPSAADGGVALPARKSRKLRREVARRMGAFRRQEMKEGRVREVVRTPPPSRDTHNFNCGIGSAASKLCTGARTTSRELRNFNRGYSCARSIRSCAGSVASSVARSCSPPPAPISGSRGYQVPPRCRSSGSAARCSKQPRRSFCPFCPFCP